ncbi:unnamed protein product [Arctogadus glacialis]
MFQIYIQRSGSSWTIKGAKRPVPRLFMFSSIRVALEAFKSPLLHRFSKQAAGAFRRRSVGNEGCILPFGASPREHPRGQR